MHHDFYMSSVSCLIPACYFYFLSKKISSILSALPAKYVQLDVMLQQQHIKLMQLIVSTFKILPCCRIPFRLTGMIPVYLQSLLHLAMLHRYTYTQSADINSYIFLSPTNLQTVTVTAPFLMPHVLSNSLFIYPNNSQTSLIIYMIKEFC